MKITSLSMLNIACFEDVTFPFGSIVLIQSRNGLGKSTVLNAIRHLFGHGHDPDFLRGGTSEGEIIAEFDDGTKVRAALTKEKTERMYKPAGGKKWNRSREFIETVSNALSYDPVAFLQKSDKEQVSDVLRLMPIDVAPKEITAALEPIEDQPKIIDPLDLAGRSPLDVINTVRSAVYEARTGMHTAADTHEKHAGELETSLQAMAGDGTDWKAEVGKLQVQVAGIDSAVQRLKEKLTGDLSRLIAEENGKRDKAMLIRENEINEQISKLRRELVDYKDECSTAATITINSARIKARETLDDFSGRQTEERTRLTTALAQTEQSYAVSLKLQSTRDAVVEAKKQAGVARVKWKAMTACLENIDRLKAEVASRLPIDIDVSGGRICRLENGALVPLSKWNDASKWTLALRIATLCHGQAGFVCIDSAGFDAFDPSHKKAFLAACQKYVDAEGMQFIMASVSDGDLKVLEVTE